MADHALVYEVRVAYRGSNKATTSPASRRYGSYLVQLVSGMDRSAFAEVRTSLWEVWLSIGEFILFTGSSVWPDTLCLRED
jgi:hypothetical protein